MTDISVWRPRSDLAVLSHEAALALCQDAEDFDMLEHVIAEDCFGLLVLDDKRTIIKPHVQGDERYSFESVMDDAIDLTQLRKRRTQQLLGEIGQAIYPLEPVTVRVMLGIDTQVAVDITVKARHRSEAGDVISNLFVSDPDFRNAIREAAFKQFMDDDSTIAIGITERKESPFPLPTGEEWAIQNT